MPDVKIIRVNHGTPGTDGADGAAGADGADGATGPAGTSLLGDEGAPSNDLGNDGDFYVDTQNGDLYTKTSGSWAVVGTLVGPTGAAGPAEAGIGITIEGHGTTISTGVKGYVPVPYDCTITKATLVADQTGSIVIDIWKDTYANFPPLDADSITASAPPTLSTAQKSEDSTLTGWTTTITAGDVLAFNVDSITSITEVTLMLWITKT